MQEYHKIQTLFKRDPATNFKTLLRIYATPAFAYLANNVWVFTEKVDGMNIRVIFIDGSVRFAGKTDAAQIPAPLVDRLRSIFDPQVGKMRELFSGEVCLYGEGYGAKIQKGGGNYSPTQDFVLFDVKVGPYWLERHNIEDVADKLGLRVVPIIGEGTLPRMVELVEAGFTSAWGEFAAEGIVARPKCELLYRNGDRIITKLKTRDFVKPQQWHDTKDV